MRTFFSIIVLLISINANAQTMQIGGTVQDTTAKKYLSNAVAMALRIKDSLLVNFTRTNTNGVFNLTLPIDTYQVLITHQNFGEQAFFVVGSTQNKEFNFGKIIMPAKSQQLKEILIYAYKDPVYYKGDTLVYVADSFKVKPNAVVDDLLKKLPGIKVDAQGKITAQGTAVDKVFVDGDEFFGGDATIATKNLLATSIASIQVYDQKNEDSQTADKQEKLKILDLKLKDEAKKGYFGKVSGSSDFNKFYQGEILANKFKNKQKISVFGLLSNTPNTSFNWSDTYKYGLNDGSSMHDGGGDDDDMMFSYQPNSGNNGIPRTLNTGFYYSDKLNKNTSINLNYSYKNNQLKTQSSTRSQYFLTDTNYTTSNISDVAKKNDSHAINFKLNQKIDSLTDLEVKSSVKLATNISIQNNDNEFISSEQFTTRRTTVVNSLTGNNTDLSASAKLKRRFIKKDRTLTLNYSYDKNIAAAEGFLKSTNDIFTSDILPQKNIDQQKISNTNNYTHSASANYVEPLSKKVKLEFEFNQTFYQANQERQANNYNNGSYSLQELTLSNNFLTQRSTSRFGSKFIYDVKKQRLAFGARARQVMVSNENLISNIRIAQNVKNILPYLSYTYRFNDNQSFTFSYFTASEQPSINQLQPILDNTNPNQITVGNSSLLPTFSNKFETHYYSYKPITGGNIWASASFNTINNDFSNSITYDNFGRTITQPINVNGNYNANFNMNIGIPTLSQRLTFYPGINSSYFKNTNYINNQKNTTQETQLGGDLSINLEFTKIIYSVSGNYSYNNPVSTLSSLSNKPYASQQYSSSIELKLPFKLSIESSGNYTINNRRTVGYNINYFIWNASVKKTFLKSENLILAINANDILNQNVSVNRSVQDNVITDTKTNIIARYIMFNLVYKFNSQKAKGDEDDF